MIRLFAVTCLALLGMSTPLFAANAPTSNLQVSDKGIIVNPCGAGYRLMASNMGRVACVPGLSTTLKGDVEANSIASRGKISAPGYIVTNGQKAAELDVKSVSFLNQIKNGLACSSGYLTGITAQGTPLCSETPTPPLPPTPSPSPAAYFEFVHQGGDGVSSFVFKVEDPALIQTLRNIVSGKDKSSPAQVMGRVVAGKENYNPKWTFHLDPQQTTLFEMTTEVCDATAPYVQANLGDWIQSVGIWCPWGSRVVREVKAP